MKKFILSLVVLIYVFAIAAYPSAGLAEESKVHAVLFFSPTCPHCHTVINEVLPPLIEKHGDNLLIIDVDVTNEMGQSLYEATIINYEIPETRYGVPALVVGDTVLVGAREIPEQFPAIIEAGLASDGIPWPDIPGLDELLQEQDLETSETETPISESNSETLEISRSSDYLSTISARFSQDVTGNLLAVVVLVGMLISIVYIGINYVTGSHTLNFHWPTWIIPLLSLLGIFIAAYLSYVEVSSSEAVCGPVGDCNSVQESPYAFLFGTIPIGLIGILGYIAILITWIIQSLGSSSIEKICTMLIWLMAWVGVLFSIYLTFLEPFVIGATCIWCISSAIIMTLILWASTPPVINGWQFNNDEDD